MVAAMEVRPHLLLVLLCLLGAGAGAGMAQSLPPSPVRAAAPPRPTPFGRTMSTVITVAISVFFFLLFFCAYINHCRLAENAAPQGANAAAAGAGASRRGKRGLDPAVVATFPIMPYREIKEHKIGRGVLECAVCLTAFEEGDDLRLLPHCSHAFHPECIDPWLEARITCPLCRANLEKPPPPPAEAPPSPEQVARSQPSPSPSPPHAVAIQVREDEEEESDEDDRKEEAMELEMLRSERRAARLPRSHSTGHSLFAASAAAAERSDHERFTLRLPHHVREQVLRSRRLRHATSLIDLAGASPEGSVRGGRPAGGGGSSFGNAGSGSSHGGRRWQAFLARTMSWARGGGDGSVRKGWDGSTRRGRDDAESSRKGAASPAAAWP